MKLDLYVIRDSKSGVHNTPFAQLNRAIAERTFKNMADDPSTNVYKNPEDFDLFFLGTYDDTTAKLELLDAPEHCYKAMHIQTPRN